MAENDAVRTTMAQLWVQENPNTVPYSLGCYALGDIEKSLGDLDQIMCQDPNTPGKFVRKAVTQGPPGLPTTSVEGLLPMARDALEKLVESGCDLSLYHTVVPCAPKTTFLNYVRGTVVEHAKASSQTKSNLMSRDADEASLQSFEFSAMDVQDFADLNISRRTHANVNAFRDICGLPFDRCQGACGEALATCDIMWAVGDRTGVVTADVYYSADGGVTWAATSADPFIASMDVTCIESIMINPDTVRLIVGCGTTQAALSLQIAYADVSLLAPGTTAWTTVQIGATNAEFFIYHGALYALGQNHIWAASNLGRIYFSSDGGLTWTSQGIAIADAIRYVFFRDADVGMFVGGATGATRKAYRTTDGGVHWTPLTTTGPVATVMATACTMHDGSRLFMGLEDGSLWYSVNGGATWAERELAKPVGFTALAAIQDIRRVDDYCMWVATGITKTGPVYWPTVMRTVNGGYDWEYWLASTAVVLSTLMFQSLLPCEGFNRAMVVGGVDVGPLGAIYDVYEV